MFVCFSTGKLGVSTPGCVNEVTEMECGHSEIDELIKEVSGAAFPEVWPDSRRYCSSSTKTSRASGSPSKT